MGARTEFKAAFASWRKHIKERDGHLARAYASGRPIPLAYTQPYTRMIAGREILFVNAKLVERSIRSNSWVAEQKHLWRHGVNVWIVNRDLRTMATEKRRRALTCIRDLRD